MLRGLMRITPKGGSQPRGLSARKYFAINMIGFQTPGNCGDLCGYTIKDRDPIATGSFRRHSCGPMLNVVIRVCKCLGVVALDRFGCAPQRRHSLSQRFVVSTWRSVFVDPLLLERLVGDPARRADLLESFVSPLCIGQVPVRAHGDVGELSGKGWNEL